MPGRRDPARHLRPVNPVRIDNVTDFNFAYWHSATWNNDGTKVIFTDEWGGGTSARCREADRLNWGANAIFDVVDRKLVFRSYYKMPAVQTRQENCVAHNGSLVPVPGRDIMTQAWYRAASRCSTSPTRPTRRSSVLRPRADHADRARHGRLLVDLLLQRPHLRDRDRPRLRLVRPEPTADLSVNEIAAASSRSSRSSTRSSSRGSRGSRASRSCARTATRCSGTVDEAVVPVPRTTCRP